MCKRCGAEKPLSDYYKDDKTCKECRKALVREYRAAHLDKCQEYDRNRPNYRERTQRQADKDNQRYADDPNFAAKVRATKDAWSNRNPEKRKAQNAISNAKRDGKIIAKTECEHCQSTTRIQAHHWSYAPEHRLDVIWLCTQCHGREHKRLGDLGRDPDKQKEEL